MNDQERRSRPVFIKTFRWLFHSLALKWFAFNAVSNPNCEVEEVKILADVVLTSLTLTDSVARKPESQCIWILGVTLYDYNKKFKSIIENCDTLIENLYS
jgi:hypothetical protein